MVNELRIDDDDDSPKVVFYVSRDDWNSHVERLTNLEKSHAELVAWKGYVVWISGIVATLITGSLSTLVGKLWK